MGVDSPHYGYILTIIYDGRFFNFYHLTRRRKILMSIYVPIKRSLGYIVWMRLVNAVRDVRTFGPSILFRRFARRDAKGIATLSTRLGEINIRPYDSDMSVLRQVFIRKDYDLSRFIQMESVKQTYDDLLRRGVSPVIIDAGANIGAASLWFSNLFPQAKIIAIEPDAMNAELCRRNCAGRPNIQIVQAAIGSSQGTVKIKKANHDNDSWSIQTERDDGNGVPIVTIAELLKNDTDNSNPLIVKIDIEGFEKDLFVSGTEWLSRVSLLIIELHDWMLPGQKTSLPFQKSLNSCKFDMMISGENLVFIK
jgi:FkbM family methyltransferase